jgi:hypothetical protein
MRADDSGVCVRAVLAVQRRHSRHQHTMRRAVDENKVHQARQIIHIVEHRNVHQRARLQKLGIVFQHAAASSSRTASSAARCSSADAAPAPLSSRSTATNVILPIKRAMYTRRADNSRAVDTVLSPGRRNNTLNSGALPPLEPLRDVALLVDAANELEDTEVLDVVESATVVSVVVAVAVPVKPLTALLMNAVVAAIVSSTAGSERPL